MYCIFTVVGFDLYDYLCLCRVICVSLQTREAVEMRAQLQKKLAQKQKEKHEEGLRALAQKAREERAGIRRVEGIAH